MRRLVSQIGGVETQMDGMKADIGADLCRALWVQSAGIVVITGGLPAIFRVV